MCALQDLAVSKNRQLFGGGVFSFFFFFSFFLSFFFFFFFFFLVGCLTSQQHANVSQERICSYDSTCCHTETLMSFKHCKLCTSFTSNLYGVCGMVWHSTSRVNLQANGEVRQLVTSSVVRWASGKASASRTEGTGDQTHFAQVANHTSD